jgi:Flp pilus assembly protein TadD
LGVNGQTEEAIRQFQETIRLKPDHADAHYNLGVALGKKGQIDEAIRQYQETLRLKPGYTASRKNLAMALATRVGSMQPPGVLTNR